MVSMRSTARRRRVALTAVFATVVLNCGLINPLDHLQGGRGDADVDVDAAVGADGESPGVDGGAEGSSVVDADGPCSRSPWTDCGVVIVATPQDPGDAVFGLSTGAVHFTDTATGEVSTATCTSDACTTPTLVVGGEDRPRRMAFASDSLYWTTTTAMRRLRIYGPPDAAPTPVETLDTLQGETELIGTWQNPYVFWTDEKGARGRHAVGDVATLSSAPSSSPSISPKGAMFVSGGEAKVRTWDLTGLGPMSTVANSAGVVRVGWSVVMLGAIFEVFGVVGAFPQEAGAGTRLLLLDKVDDAGAPLVLANEASAVRSFVGTGDALYWTNDAGELRRRANDSNVVKTLLRGLSSNTSLRGTKETSSILITDRGSKKILLYTPR